MAKKFLTPIDMNNLEIKNFRVHNASSTNGSPTGITVTSDKPGELWYDSTNNVLKYWTGSSWIALTANTDTHHTSKNITTNSSTSTTQTTSALTNGNVYLNHVENGSVRSSHKISGSGRATVTTDSSGNIAVNSAAYSAATTSADGLMSSTDKTKLNGIATGAEVNVQSDWNQTTTTADDYIKNKPTLGEAAAKDVDTTIGSTTVSDKLPTTNAVKEYVSAQVGAVDAMRFKGTVGNNGNPGTLPTSGVKVGDTYRVITAGTYAGQTCEIGDLIIAIATTPTWTVAQTNIDGAVTASLTTANGCLAKFTGDKIVANGPQLGSSTTTFLRNDGSWATPVGSVTGVKGNSETSYRTGQVNLTAANVGAAASSHTHGNIQNGGTLQTNDIAIASGDKLVVTDSSDSSKIARTSLAFDGSTVTKYLSQKGTWEKPPIPVATSTEYGGIKTGFTTSNADRQYAVQLSDGDQAYVTVPTATTSIPGLMSATDKSTLNTLSAHTLATTTLTIAQNGTQTSSTPTTLPGRMVSYIAIMDGEAVEVDAAITFGDPNDSVKFTTGTAAPSAITIRVWYC